MPSERATDPATAVADVNVPVAGFALAVRPAVLSSAGIGSCVAIMLHDPHAGMGGLAHVLLPHESLSRDRSRPAKFASTAVRFLAGELRAAGAAGPFTARLVGGASMFGSLLRSGGVNMGERNVHAARLALADAGVPLVGEDVGGEHGRSVSFDVGSGVVRVASLRAGDRVV